MLFIALDHIFIFIFIFISCDSLFEILSVNLKIKSESQREGCIEIKGFQQQQQQQNEKDGDKRQHYTSCNLLSFFLTFWRVCSTDLTAGSLVKGLGLFPSKLEDDEDEEEDEDEEVAR